MRMREEKNSLRLSEQERETLSRTVKDPQVCRTIRQRCQILLSADENHGRKTRAQVAMDANVSISTVFSTLSLYQEGGLERILSIQRNRNSDTANKKVTEEMRSLIFQLQESDPPPGKKSWSTRELARVFKEQTGISLGKSTILRVLKEK